jgi:hypothetical protein
MLVSIPSLMVNRQKLYDDFPAAGAFPAVVINRFEFNRSIATTAALVRLGSMTIPICQPFISMFQITPMVSCSLNLN